MSLDAMKQALEALEEAVFYTSSESWSPSMTRECEAAITALRAAIEQAQEPVAHTLNCVCGAVWDVSPHGVEEMVHAPTPRPRQWQKLTDEEIAEIAATPAAIPGRYVHSFARAIEAKLREKNRD